MLKLFIHAKEVPITLSKFPAGETMISIEDDRSLLSVDNHIIFGIITMKFEGNDDLINLALLKDCVDRKYYGRVQLALEMHYVPYARQDRVCNAGESLSIKVIANIINSMGFSNVFTKDNHSEVSTALINNCVNTGITMTAAALPYALPKGKSTILVSPDAGANKKVYGFAKDLEFKHVVRADKTRDLSTGKITGTKVYWDVLQPINTIKSINDVCIIDDICDGGYTFTQLAHELRKFTDGKVFLYVTHGIFSKGLVPFVGLIDTIYVSNLFGIQHPERIEALEREVNGMVTIRVI